MGDEQGRLAHDFGQLQKFILKPAADQRIERRKGFIHEQDFRIGCERPREPYALLHPPGQLSRHAVAVALQAHRFDHLVGELHARESVDIAKLQRKGDVVAHRAVWQQRHVLKHHADAIGTQQAQLTGVEATHINPADTDLAVCGFDQAVDVAHERRLAGTRQTHDAENLALMNIEGHFANANDGLKLLQYVSLAEVTLLDGSQRFVGAITKDLPDIAHLDDGVTCGAGGGFRVCRHGVSQALARLRVGSTNGISQQVACRRLLWLSSRPTSSACPTSACSTAMRAIAMAQSSAGDTVALVTTPT